MIVIGIATGYVLVSVPVSVFSQHNVVPLQDDGFQPRSNCFGRGRMMKSDALAATVKPNARSALMAEMMHSCQKAYLSRCREMVCPRLQWKREMPCARRDDSSWEHVSPKDAPA